MMGILVLFRTYWSDKVLVIVAQQLKDPISPNEVGLIPRALKQGHKNDC